MEKALTISAGSFLGQCAELYQRAMNCGVPPLAATNPSLDYHTKGIDIAAAVYVAELGYLAN